MNSNNPQKETRQLKILEEVEKEPEIKQADIASRLELGIGTVNWYIKRLSKKGFIKVKRISQWQWKYILTPKGMKEKAKLTRDYVKRSMNLYRGTREQAQQLLQEVKQNGYQKVHIEGDNDLADVCKLTCLEQGVKAVDSKLNDSNKGQVPVIKVSGLELRLEMPKSHKVKD